MSYNYRPPYDEEYEEYDKERYFDDGRRGSSEDYREEYDDYSEKRHHPTGKKCKVVINTLIYCEEGMYKKTKEYELDCDEHKPIINRIDCSKLCQDKPCPKIGNRKHK